MSLLIHGKNLLSAAFMAMADERASSLQAMRAAVLREVFCANTRALLGQRISLGEDGFRRILSLIDSEKSLPIAAIEA